MRGRIAADMRWAREPDRTEATEPARDGFLRKFEREVDPEGVLDPVERARRASNLLRAHMTKLARKSAASRRATTTTATRRGRK
jgi:hypothetical protein